MATTSPSAAYVERLASFRFGRGITLLLLLNVVLFWLGYLILGGCDLLAETHEGEHWLRPWSGDEFRVSAAVGRYSFLHGLSVVLTLPSLAICAVMLAWEWVQLRRARLA